MTGYYDWFNLLKRLIKIDFAVLAFDYWETDLFGDVFGYVHNVLGGIHRDEGIETVLRKYPPPELKIRGKRKWVL